MKTYVVNVSEPAQWDLAEIKKNLEETIKSEEYVSNYIKSFYTFLETLSYFPNRFPATRNINKDGVFERRCSLGKHYIYYQVDENVKIVTILRVVHFKRKQPRGLCDVIQDDVFGPDGRIALSELVADMSDEEIHEYFKIKFKYE